MWLLKSLVESIVFLPVTVNDVIVLCANVVRTIGALFKYLQITYLANQWGFLISIWCTIMCRSFVEEITQYRYWLKISEYFLTRVSFTENIYRRINNSGPIVVVEANWIKTAFSRYNSSHYYLREGAFKCRAHSTKPPLNLLALVPCTNIGLLILLLLRPFRPSRIISAHLSLSISSYKNIKTKVTLGNYTHAAYIATTDILLLLLRLLQAAICIIVFVLLVFNLRKDRIQC